MPRSGPSGTYTLPPIYLAVPGTAIVVDQHNLPLEDIQTTFNTVQPIDYGGTGAATATGAVAALGAASLTTTNTFTMSQYWAKGSDIASASTLILPTNGNYFDVTGTTTVNAISSAGVGTWIKLHFDAALTLTDSADLVLPGGANIVTAAGDEAEFVEYASGDWRCTNYQKAAGVPTALPTLGSAGQVLQVNSGATALEYSTPVFSKSFTSTEQTITANSTLTLAHGLGAVPLVMDLRIRCKTTDLGYSVDEEVQLTGNVVNGLVANNIYIQGTSVSADATNIYINLCSTVLSVVNKTSPSAVSTITYANWRFVVRAFS